MEYNTQIQAFVVQHQEDDVDRLLLSARRYPDIDVPWAVDQILARRQLRYKLPEWYANAELMMSGRVPAEQCSSELTARYKRQLVTGNTLCDMTGGMGVDLYYMSQGLASAIYIERQATLCEAARHNFPALGATHIEVRQGDARDSLPSADTIYLDPARRANDGSRVYDLAACEPDVVRLYPELMEHCRRLVVKISPMADLNRVLQLLPAVSEIHVLAVRNECKEVLLVIDKENDSCNCPDEEKTNQGKVMVYCVDFKTSGEIRFQYAWADEQLAQPIYGGGCLKYLYEPDVTIMKAGAFKYVSQKFGVQKLEVNSHLYTSADLQPLFPGRVFEVDEVMPFASKSVKTLKKTIPQANVATRNFLLTAEQFRARTGIKDGGDVYLFATTLRGIGQCLLRCHKCLTVLLLLFTLVGAILFPSSASAKRKELTLDEWLTSEVPVVLPAQWVTGMRFVYLEPKVNILLHPEGVVSGDTTTYQGSIWTFDSFVSEENWLGQSTISLRFLASNGIAFRFDTEKSMDAVVDGQYNPRIPGLVDYENILKVDSLLRARTLYITTRECDLISADTAAMLALYDKFVPVVIDSVTYGTELAPLRVWYSRNGYSASLMTCLSNSYQALSTRPIQRMFSLTDPREDYPSITDDKWSAIIRGKVIVDMTTEEVLLSLGKPDATEKNITSVGVVEKWSYKIGHSLVFWDGRLHGFMLTR